MRLALPGGVVCLMLVILASLAPDETWGRHFRRHRCRRCQRMAEICVCPAPVQEVCPPVCPPVACPTTVTCPPVTSSHTTLKPIVETCYVQKPVMSTRNVQETCYRQERYLETVPTTVCENVTVDEGGYQMVWVPKIVTRQVPKTVMTQRPACRTVPVTVNRQITECVTQTVPVQRVRYVPETRTVSCVTTVSTGGVAAAYGPTCAAPVMGPGMMGPMPNPVGNQPIPQPQPQPTEASSINNSNPVPEPMPAGPNTSYLGRPTPVVPRSQTAMHTPEQMHTAVSPSAASVWRTSRPAR